jgi:hypothetical protein
VIILCSSICPSTTARRARAPTGFATGSYSLGSRGIPASRAASASVIELAEWWK